MCDYSLHNVASRPAKIADELVVSKFANSLTRGFSAVGEPGVAVCMLPGTELAFVQEVECEHSFARLLPWFGFGKLGGKVARFRQINVESTGTHHDALEFANGKVVLVTKLRVRQRATVLQLPAQVRTVKDSDHQQSSILIGQGWTAEDASRRSNNIWSIAHQNRP